MSHISYIRRIPIVNTGTSSIVKCRCSKKHACHNGHTWSIPTTYILIKCCCGTKHTLYWSHTRYIPATYILIENWSSFKHISHIHNTRCIPNVNITVSSIVEGSCIIKHSSHISHTRCIPKTNIWVKRRIVVKKLTHISNQRSTQIVIIISNLTCYCWIINCGICYPINHIYISYCCIRALTRPIYERYVSWLSKSTVNRKQKQND